MTGRLPIFNYFFAALSAVEAAVEATAAEESAEEAAVEAAIADESAAEAAGVASAAAESAGFLLQAAVKPRARTAAAVRAIFMVRIRVS